MPIDPSVFQNLHTFQDYDRANQEFLARKQAAQIENASKSNIYATQVLSAATATGDQNQYDNARRTLAGNGIDVSIWAPDVQTGAQQAQAARLAQSPLGSLLNAGLKAESNGIAATQAMGSVTSGQQLDPLSQSLMGGLGLNMVKGATPQPATQPARSPVVNQVQAGTPAGNQAINDLYGDNQPPPPSVMPSAAPVPSQPVTLTQNGAPVNDNPPPQASASVASQAIPKFSPRPQRPDETNQAYSSAIQRDFEDYKADPNYLAAAARASELGKAEGTATENAIKSEETAGRLQPNFQALRNINNDVPDSTWGIPAEAKAWGSQANPFGDHKSAQAFDAWKMVNEQQTLNALGQLVAGGQIRSNRQIVKMLETGNFVPSGLAAPERLMLINTLENESKNQAISAGNIASRLNGGQAQPYVQTIAPGSTGAPNTPKLGTTMQGTDGSYLFNGGDPSDKNNWKKVK